MSSLPMISSLSIPLRQPGPKVLSLPDGPRLSTSSLTSSTAPSPSSFPPSRPPGARACAPPLPPRRVAAGSPRLRSHSSPPFQEHGQRKPSSFPPSQAREPAPAWLACARLPVEGDCARAAWHVGRGGRRPAPALVQASSAGAATPTGSPAAVDAPHPAISPPIQALGKVPCKFLLLPSSSTSPSRATGAGNGSAPPWLGCPRADELFRPAAPAPAGAPGAPHLGEPKPGSFPTGSSPSTSLPPESDDFLSVAAAAASRG